MAVRGGCHQRAQRLSQVAAGTLGSLVLVAGTALAAAPASAQGLKAYGPTESITVGCTISGATITCTVTGTGFLPNETITVTIDDPAQFGTPTTSTATGTFSVTGQVPCPSPPSTAATFTATGSGGDSGTTATTLPTIAGCTTAAATGGGGSGSSGSSGTSTGTGSSGSSSQGSSSGSSGSLSYTGADVTATAAIGAAAVAAGGLLVLSGRRRRRTPRASTEP